MITSIELFRRKLERATQKNDLVAMKIYQEQLDYCIEHENDPETDEDKAFREKMSELSFS